MAATITHETEKEYKSLLKNRKHYEYIEKIVKGFATFEDSYEQINYYFDTDSCISHHESLSLRIRKKQQTWTLTAKTGKRSSYNYSLCDETNIELTEEEAKRYFESGIPTNHPLFEFLGLAFSSPVICVGSLITHRTDYLFNEDIISMDINHYEGTTDFEFEWETNNDMRVHQFNDLLRLRFGNGRGKRKRFLLRKGA